MNIWKLIITDGLEESGLAILRREILVDIFPNSSPAELLSVVSEYHAMIVRSRTKVTDELIRAARSLKVIGRAGVGVDNIDLDSARRHGIIVVNTPLSTSLAVAELTLGLMFSLARSIPYADRSMKDGLWQKKELTGIELAGKTLGVIGMGNIGSALSQRATALGMVVVGYDPLLIGSEILKRGALPVSMDDLLSRSDFISLHVPLTDSTKGMIGAPEFERMKSTAQLICTARGGLIDESALYQALEQGCIAGAALDVFAQEPPGLTPIIIHPRVIATPHIGAQTEEAQGRAAEDIASEVLAALRGDPLRWQVA